MSNHHLLKNMKLCEAFFGEEFFLSIYNWRFPLATLLQSSFGPTKIIGPSYEPFALLLFLLPQVFTGFHLNIAK